MGPMPNVFRCLPVFYLCFVGSVSSCEGDGSEGVVGDAEAGSLRSARADFDVPMERSFERLPVVAPTQGARRVGGLGRAGHVRSERGLGTVQAGAPRKLANWMDAWEEGSDSGPAITALRCELLTLQCLENEVADRTRQRQNRGYACGSHVGRRVCATGQTRRLAVGIFDDCIASLPRCLEKEGHLVNCAAAFAYCFAEGQGRNF
ncbi:MAG: hypothetical protein V3V08_09095 [Nannocystaceae bacterium]